MAEILEGLIIPNIPGSTVEPEQPAFHAGNSVDLAVATFNSLGLIRDKAETHDHFSRLFDNLEKTLKLETGTAIEPFISIDLNERFTLQSLISAFDIKQRGTTFMKRRSIWHDYSEEELNSRHMGLPGKTNFGGLSGTARVHLLATEHKDEPGLVFVDKSIREQAAAAKGHQLLNIADYIILQAQRRESGCRPIDDSWRTFTHFPQLDGKQTNFWGDIAHPGTYYVGYNMHFYDAIGVSGKNVGVRLTAGD